MADNDLKQVTYGIEFDVDTNGIDKVEEKTGLVDTALQKLSSVLESFQNNLNKTSDTAKLMGDAMNKINDDGINKYNQQLELADRKLDILGTQYSLAAEKARSLYEESNKTVERFGAQSDQAMKVKEQLANAQMKELNLEEAVQKAGEAFEKQRELVDRVTNGIEKNSLAEDSTFRNINKVSNTLSKANEGAKAVNSSTRGISSGINESNKSANIFGKSMEGVKSSFLNIKNVVAGIAVGLAGKGIFDSTIGNSANFEQYQTSFKVMMGSASEAQKKLQDLYNYANNTPFQVNDVIQAGRTLMTFGLNTQNWVQDAGNLAAASNNSITETAMALGRINSGDFGEAFERLRDFGISQKMLEGQGLKFDKQGSFQGSTQQAMTAVENIIKTKYGNMTQEQSKTFNGLMSTFKDQLSMFGKDIGDKAFPQVKKALSDTMKEMDKLKQDGTLQEFADISGKAISGLAKGFTDLIKIIALIGKSFKDIAPILAGVTGAFLTMKTVTGAQNLFKAFSEANLGGLKGFLSMAGGIALIAKGFEELKSGNTGLGALLIGTGAGLMAIQKVGLLKSGVIGLVAAGFVELKEGNTNLAGLLFGVAGALAALNIALAVTDGLSAPILLIIGAIGLAIMLIVTHLGTLQSAWSSTWQAIKEVAEGVINFIIGKLDDFINKLNTPIKLMNQLTGTNFPTIPTVPLQHFAENKGTQGSKQQTVAVKGGGRVSAFASGTNFAPGGLSLVGEKGPELVELPQGAKVTPNNQLNQALGQKTAQNFSSITDEYSKQVKLMQPLFNTYGQNLNTNLSTGITNTKQNVSGAVGNTTSNAGNLLNNFTKGSYNYGTGMVGEMSQGVTDSSNNLTGVVSTLTNKVIDTFKQGFGIHSPSRVMYKIGDYLMQGLVNGMTSKDMEGFVSNWIGSMSSAAGGAVGGNLSGWISAAMALTGVPSNWFGALSSIIQHESGGDPNSINLWDSNAKAGHPSKGLMQLIDENMSEYHLPGMTNIYDPVSNIAAGIKYIEARYGSIFNVPGISSLARGGNYVGYATGTNSATAGLHLTGENGPELINFRGGEQVKTASETKNILQRTYSNSTSSSSKNINVEAPQISITIKESKDANSTAQEVKKIIEEYFKNMGIVTSIQTS